MDHILRDRLSMLAALGAGIVVGISGIYLYYKANKCVTRELSHLTGTIESLRREIEELKAAASQTSKEKKERISPEKRKNVSLTAGNTSKHFAGYTSSSIEDEEEYYDFTDTEEVIGNWASVNGPLADAGATGTETWFTEIDSLLEDDSSDKESLYCMMTTKKEKYISNAEFLWRLAKVTHLCGVVAETRGEPEKKKELAFEAVSYAKKSLELNKQHPDVHKWCAITIGSLADYVSTQEKITNGFIFKDHVEQALALKPLDPTLHYMIGRFCYEVASLSWLERKLATALYSSVPETTLEEARSHLMEADRLKPDWKENLLYIAKTFIAEGDYSNAISWIDRALKLPVSCEGDELADKELKDLEYKYQTYRAT